MAYCEKSDVEGLGGEFTIPAAWNDADVAAAIADAQSIIDSVTGNHFEATARTLYLSGDGSTLLRTVEACSWPIVTITNVYWRETYNNDDDFETAGTEVDNDTFMISKSRRALIRIVTSTVRGSTSGVRWIKGNNNYRVKGTFGRASVPKPIKRACVFLIRETITAGTIMKYEQPIQERYPDGYMITLMRERTQQTASMLPLTGYRVVDNLLRPYQRKLPMMAVAKG